MKSETDNGSDCHAAICIK